MACWQEKRYWLPARAARSARNCAGRLRKFKPGRLVLFELNEFALYNVEQEFQANFPDIPMVFAIGDIKDQARLSQVFSQYRPEVVFHAAAYKHVPLMEHGKCLASCPEQCSRNLRAGPGRDRAWSGKIRTDFD